MSASFAPECNDMKEKYDACFYKWYSEKYLRGVTKEDDCEKLFNKYQSCLTKALRERGVDKMLEEARKDNRENDSMHLRKS